MELNLHSGESGTQTGSMSVSEKVFGVEYKEPLIHQVVSSHMASGRSGTKAQKSRSQVRGGGAKPWRQKGTGRARAGTSRSPIWRSGGVTFAAVPRDYAKKVNRKMYRIAMGSILSELVRQERLLVVDDLNVPQPKTGDLVKTLKALNVENVLILVDKLEDNLYLASRNLHSVAVSDTASVDPVSLIGYDRIVATQAAVKQLEEKLS